MNPMRPPQTWLLCLLIVHALGVQPVREKDSNSSESSLQSTQLSSNYRLNQTSLSPDTSANGLAVFCDGDHYGRDLVAADCKDAITAIQRTRQRMRFGERSADPDTWDVGLPARQIGSEDAAVEILLVCLLCHLTLK